ncbi:hypothetical protein AOQ84DRAFT_405225 [Glonium stellatum]|uniref:Heterokaryon incompatibility domain-containing protein n=1 Tax=Glonium stellatum TaxID=574774 RepID=A0A8E2JTN2_9PEZI|nr:hypothetical protein AOQ84DRAFT_405225 [Glonium stellatum]
MAYKYEPLPMRGYIRLLQVSSESSEVEAIQGSLRIVNLDDNPHYKCLSYTWEARNMMIKENHETMVTDLLASEDQEHQPYFLEKEFLDCDYSDTELVAIVDLFVGYRWFSRIWITQEFILARELRFLCGTIIVPFRTIWKGNLLLTQAGCCSAWNRVNSKKEFQWARTFASYVVGEHIRRETKEPMESIETKAHCFRDRQATGPRDKVFGLLLDNIEEISNLYNLILTPQPITSITEEDVSTIVQRTLIADGYHMFNDNLEYGLKTSFEQWLSCQTCSAVAARDPNLAASFVKDPERNLASAMQLLEVSGPFERLKDVLLRGHNQCDSWEKVVTIAEGRRRDPRYERYLDTTTDEFYSQWRFAGKNRSLGLETVRAGNRIYLLQGANVPYVFRHRPADPEDVLDLEGEAYLHGIMYGEAARVDSLAFRKFTVY